MDEFRLEFRKKLFCQMEIVLYMWGITGEEYYAAQSQMRFPLL